MQVECHLCGSRHVLDDKQIGGHPRVRFRCGQCGQTTEVDISGDANRTSITVVGADAVPFVEPTVIEGQRGLGLPGATHVSLVVTAGKSKGLRHLLARPRIIIGRLGADVAVDDSEVSRWHCAIEVTGDQIHLRDLDSRNGVFIGDEKIKSAELKNESEFRIGSTIFRLSVSPK